MSPEMQDQSLFRTPTNVEHGGGVIILDVVACLGIFRSHDEAQPAPSSVCVRTSASGLEATP